MHEQIHADRRDLIQIKGEHMSIYKVGNRRTDGLIPGVSGERAFPTHELGYETTNTLNATDPFIMLDHIAPSKMAAGWRLSGDQGIHPHRGFETITFMFKGNLHQLKSKSFFNLFSLC